MRRGLWRGAHPRARQLAILCAVAGSTLAFVLFLTAAIGGTSDADRYGRVPLGKARALDLPAGDVAVYYEERVTLQNDDTLAAPPGIRAVARQEGRKVRSQRVTPNSINLDGRSLVEFGKLAIPAAGRWKVRARADAGGGNGAAVTLGKGQAQSFGRAGVRAGIAEGAGLVAALLLLLLWRRRDEEPPPAAPSAPAPTSIRV